MLSGMVRLIGSVGDAYDNTLVETTIGPYKTEAFAMIHRSGEARYTGWLTSTCSPRTGSVGSTPPG